jgi:hypothetical protein
VRLLGQLLLAQGVEHVELLGQDVVLLVAARRQLDLRAARAGPGKGQEPLGLSYPLAPPAAGKPAGACRVVHCAVHHRPALLNNPAGLATGMLGFTLEARSQPGRRRAPSPPPPPGPAPPRSPTFMMICLLGTIMVTPLNRALRFSGSSWRPA